MSAELFFLKTTRILDSNGIADGATLTFYDTGTLNKRSVYTTAALDVTHPNPLTVASGAALPDIYLDSTYTYRCIVRNDEGDTIDDIDPYLGLSAGGLSFIADGAGAVSRSVQDRLREQISVKDFGATGDGVTDDRAAINLAVATLVAGDTLFFPPGTYLVSKQPGVHTVIDNLPEGTNAYGLGATIKVSTGSATSQIFTPKGNNIIYGFDFDGQSLPETSDVEDNAWVTESQAIRAFGGIIGIDYAEGATDVSIVNCRFRNFNYAVQSWGAQRWRIEDCQFRRTKASSIIFQYNDDNDCLHNLVEGCYFEDCGDTAVAYSLESGTLGVCAYNELSNCTAKDTQLRTQGFAFDHEENPDPSKQHHNIFVGLTVEQTNRGLTYGRGGAVMNGSSYSQIIGFAGKGSLEANGDYGVAIQSGVHCEIVSANVEDFRGAGVALDGSVRCAVRGGSVINCGEIDNSHPGIILADALATDGCSVDGTEIAWIPPAAWSGATAYAVGDTASRLGVTYLAILAHTNHQPPNATYWFPLHDATSAAVAARSSTGHAPKNLSIRARVKSPWGAGVYVTGLVGTGPPRITNVHIDIDVERTDTSATAAVPVQMYGVDGGSIKAKLRSCSYGYVCTSCTNITIRDGEYSGSTGVLGLYDFGTGGTASTGVQVRDMRTYASVSTAILNAGTGTTWINDNQVVTRASGTSAAIATGATIAHGLAFAPTFVSVTAAEAGPTDITASADATNITVNFGGGGSKMFYWEGRV